MKNQNHKPEDIIEVEFEVGGFFDGMTKYHFVINDTGSVLTTSGWTIPESVSNFSHYETIEMQKRFMI